MGRGVRARPQGNGKAQHPLCLLVMRAGGGAGRGAKPPLGGGSLQEAHWPRRAGQFLFASLQERRGRAAPNVVTLQ